MTVNALGRGFYTVPEAARLIEVGNARRIAGWLSGYPYRSIGPLLQREYQPVGRTQELGFLDLIEVRFVEHFREQGVKVRTLRLALDTARRVFATTKPLASEQIRFLTDGKDILAEEVLKPAAQGENDPVLWSLVTRQYQILEAIKATLLKGVEFDPKTHLARAWKPRPEMFGDIIINPRVAYGQPVGPSMVPTAVLYEAWQAEAQEFDAVADWYHVPLPEVKAAVEFEHVIRRPREKLAA